MAMPADLRERVAGFLGPGRVFSRAEFAEALCAPEGSRAVGRLLAREVGAGRIRRVRRGVFVAASDAESPGRFVVPDYLVASRLRPDAVLGYHTALELYGIQYSAIISEVQVLSRGRPGHTDLPFGRCRFIRPHRALEEAGRTDCLTVTVEAMGVPVRGTAFERALVDAFHRPDRACGRDEVIDSLAYAPVHLNDFDCRRVADYVELLGIRHLAGAVGWCLERWRTEMNVSERTLDRLRAMLPRSNSYALGARPGNARLADGWRVLLPPDALDTTFEGWPVDWEC